MKIERGIKIGNTKLKTREKHKAFHMKKKNKKQKTKEPVLLWFKVQMKPNP